MQIIISKISIVFIYISIGFICNKLKILPEEANNYLIPFLLDITTPCLLLSAISKCETNDNLIRNTTIVFLISFLFFIMAAIFSIFMTRKLKTDNKSDKNVLSVAMTSSNNGFMGFPIANAVFGNTVFYYMAIQNVSLNLYLFTISLFQLNFGEEKNQSPSISETFKSFIHPVTIISILSVIMLFCNITLPDYISNIFTELGNITIPLSMIVVGIQLGDSNIKDLISKFNLLYTSAIKLIVIPAIFTLFIFFIPIDNDLKTSLVLTSILPTAVISVALAKKEQKNGKLMAEALASTTLFSMITLPIWILIISKLFP